MLSISFDYPSYSNSLYNLLRSDRTGHAIRRGNHAGVLERGLVRFDRESGEKHGKQTETGKGAKSMSGAMEVRVEATADGGRRLRQKRLSALLADRNAIHRPDRFSVYPRTR